MNPVNEFTTEGKPRFLISNMPLETSGDVNVTRPEIYFGERTDTDVYVKTKQREFDYPQGENNNYTSYEGDGGFAVGSGLRRLCIAWATGDLAKLPFSDDVTSESRVLMHRNIIDRIGRIAPFLAIDDDPYIVINSDGRLDLDRGCLYTLKPLSVFASLQCRRAKRQLRAQQRQGDDRRLYGCRKLLRF